MTFPNEPLPITVELGEIVTPGVWTDVTSDVRVSAGIQITRGRADESSDAAPQTCTLTFDNRLGKYSARNPAGPFYGKLGRNTLLRVKVGTSVRFVGEVAEWPPRWDTSEKERYVSITAAGIKRRLSQWRKTTASSYKSTILAADPFLYFPLDEGPLAGYGRGYKGQSGSASSSKFVRTVNVDWKFAEGDLGTELPKGLSINTTNSGVAGTSLIGLLPFLPAEDVALDFVYRAEDMGDLDIRLDDYADHRWYVLFIGDTNEINVSLQTSVSADSGLTSLGTSAAGMTVLTDGETHHFRLRLVQVGANIDWTLYVDGDVILSGTRNSTVFSGLKNMSFVYHPFGDDTPIAVGHVAVWEDPVPDVDDMTLAMRGYAGETAGNRMDRVCAEALVGFASVGDLDDTVAMGPQVDGDILAQLADAAAADMGSLYEPRDTLGFVYRTRESTYNQTPALTISYAAKEVSPPIEPTDDDQATRNDVTVTRSNGGSARQVLTEGRLSIADPPDGVGPYENEATLNVASDDQLPDIAGWMLHLGTWDEARYPVVRVDRATPPVVANPTLSAALLDVDIDDLLVITGMYSQGIYDNVKLLVRGYTETLGQFSHAFDFNCSPAGPYDVGVYATDVATTGSRYNPDGCELAEALDATETSIDVSVERGPLLSDDDLPCDIMVGGERMTVTAVNAENIQFVSNGTGASAVNAPVAPTLPPFVQAGDLVLIFASIRNSGTGVPDTPTDWTLLADMSNACVYGRVYDGVWTMPTITFTGGVANADTLAQACAFRGVGMRRAAPFPTLNSSAQNIATPDYGAANEFNEPRIVIWLGWKQDDWTSVATINHPGAIEIQERTSGLGNDASQVWDYKAINDTYEDIPARSFVVSGGAAAISRAAVLVLQAGQTLTVTRSVNGVVKSHDAGTEVQVFEAARYAL